MKKLSYKELRDEWISFYEERGHKDIGTVSLVGDGTTGVLFNVAGMQSLIPYLLGQSHPAGKRLCNIQGCVRTNDIDSVGDSSHATFFEMMGNWSLGDYFKEESIEWSFDLFTKVFEIPRDKLATTCFKGDETAPRDEEAAIIKEKVGFKKENIYFLPKSDNWWEIESGPCGPDSEYFYITDVPACSDKCNPSCGCGHFIELGNDVFMQYEKIDKDKYIPLKSKNIDTGWGLERILAFLNTEDGDIYKTEVYSDALSILEEKLGVKYNTNKDIDNSIRIILDHTRTATMLLGDEKHLTPSNVGAGYILRRIIRRAIRHIKKLNLDHSVITDISKCFIEKVYAIYYPGLLESEDFILSEINKETNNFLRTLSNGLKELEKMIDKTLKENTKKLDSALCFKLYDTYGFPYELTEEILKEKNITASKEEFDKYMESQKNLARQNAKKMDDLKVLGDIVEFKEDSVFIGYNELETSAKVIFVGDLEGNKKDIINEGIIVLNKTPFYATMGGQKCDIGTVSNDNFKADVYNVEKAPNGQHILYVNNSIGSISVGDVLTAKVDEENRYTTCQNHTATHLLQKALQDVLGNEVHQAGSYVDGERLRFDFKYTEKIKDEDLYKVESLVNDMIKASYEADINEMDIKEAKKLGAMALFDDKYKEKVRVVKFGPSIELCGGTHIDNTSNIKSFAIKSIESKGLNIYRIEAVCDTNLEVELYEEIKPYNNEMITLLEKAKDIVEKAKIEGIELDMNISISNERPKCYKDIIENRLEVTNLRKSLAELEKTYNDKRIEKASSSVDDYLKEKQKGLYGEVLLLELENQDMNVLKSIIGNLESKLDNGIVFIINKNEESVNFLARCNNSLKDKVNMGTLVKNAALIVDGNGGGSPFFAQGGGNYVERVEDVVSYVKDNILK